MTFISTVGDHIGRLCVVEAAVEVGIDGVAAFLVGVPVLPVVITEVLAVDRDHLRDRQAVLLGEREIALVVRRHAHHGAVAVAHQHVVADPDLDALAAQRMGDEKPGRHAELVARREFGFGRAAGTALLDKRGERRVRLRGVRGERMLGRDGAKAHPHDGVGARREDPQPTLLDQLAVGARDLVREREAHPLALADPVLLSSFLPRRTPSASMSLSVTIIRNTIARVPLPET